MLYLLVLIDSFFCSHEGLTLETSALEILQWSIYIINSVMKPDNLFPTVSAFFLIAFFLMSMALVL